MFQKFPNCTLHLAVERYYTTILLVFTEYSPKEHDLKKLDFRVRNCDARFHVFPRETEQEKDAFELLKRAYIDSRYKMDEFQISKEQLVYLAERVQTLKGLTEEIVWGRLKRLGLDSCVLFTRTPYRRYSNK